MPSKPSLAPGIWIRHPVPRIRLAPHRVFWPLFEAFCDLVRGIDTAKRRGVEAGSCQAVA
jgi:hypothetical protein